MKFIQELFGLSLQIFYQSKIIGKKYIYIFKNSLDALSYSEVERLRF